MTRPNSGGRSLTEQEMLAYLQENVRQAGECHLWAGPFDRARPLVKWRHRRWSARRLLLELQGTAIGPGRIVYVTCDEPHCMTHLAVGTKKQAVRMYRKHGRHATGSIASIAAIRSHAKRARLGAHRAEDVLRMRAQGMTLEQIGAHYGVTAQAVHAAIGRWSRLPPMRKIA